MPDALFRISDDEREFGFIDQSKKRLGHYRILNHAPWFEPVVAPSTLPKSCIAHALLVHKGMLIVGGHSDYGEALWVRQKDADQPWLVIPMPEGICKRGKAIDGLFIRDRELIAVDDIVLPKWILVYPLDPVLNGVGVRKVHLGSHTTYERITLAVEGKRHYALFSHGMNHGTETFYISLICKNDLQEAGCWSGYFEQSTQSLLDDICWEYSESELVTEFDSVHGIRPPHMVLIDAALDILCKKMEKSRLNIGGMLSATSDMVFCGDYLVLALGKDGAASANATLKATRSGKSNQDSVVTFHSIQPTKITAIDRLENANGSTAGVYAIGPDTNGTVSYEWIAAERLFPT